MLDPLRLHREAIIIDVTCPLARSRQYIDWWREGGATAIAPTVTGMSGNAQSGLARLTERLAGRGFNETDIRKVLGLNWLRVYRTAWGA